MCVLSELLPEIKWIACGFEAYVARRNEKGDRDSSTLIVSISVFVYLYMYWVNISDLLFFSPCMTLLKRWHIIWIMQPPSSPLWNWHLPPSTSPDCLFVLSLCVPVTQDRTSSLCLSAPADSTLTALNTFTLFGRALYPRCPVFCQLPLHWHTPLTSYTCLLRVPSRACDAWSPDKSSKSLHPWLTQTLKYTSAVRLPQCAVSHTGWSEAAVLTPGLIP